MDLGMLPPHREAPLSPKCPKGNGDPILHVLKMHNLLAFRLMCEQHIHSIYDLQKLQGQGITFWFILNLGLYKHNLCFREKHSMHVKLFQCTSLKVFAKSTTSSAFNKSMMTTFLMITSSMSSSFKTQLPFVLIHQFIHQIQLVQVNVFV